MHLHLHHEAKQWPDADHFLDALPDTPYDISSQLSFDESVVPGPKSVIGLLPPESIVCLRKLYSKLYPAYENQVLEGEVSIPSTFRKYSSITWQGKKLSSTLDKSVKNSIVFVAPPFSFTTSVPTEFEGKERPAEIDYFLVHSVILPGTQEPKAHLLARAKWPMVHPNRHYFGKPVEIWCSSIYEPQSSNQFVLASSIAAHAIISFEKVSGERVCIAIPLVD